MKKPATTTRIRRPRQETPVSVSTAQSTANVAVYETTKDPFIEVVSRMKKNLPLKLDIACGASKHGPDWIGIDIQDLPGVDIVQDIETYPWPVPDACIDLALGSHVAEHINPAKFGFINWMNEIWRVLKPGAQLMLALPYAGSPGYWQDPTHVNPCNETTWVYFDPCHESGFYKFYRPKPWKILNIYWDQQGFMEVALEKRIEDPSYAK